MSQTVQVASSPSPLAFGGTAILPLLSLLPPGETSRLRLLLTRVRWVSGQVVYEAGERIEHVYFVEWGLVSLMAISDDADIQAEVGMIGREGMVGLTALLGPDAVSFNRAVVQVPGSALRMGAQALREVVGTMPTLRQLLSQVMEVTMARMAQTVVCNSRHVLAQRLARWLLTVHDRVDGDELEVTQESIAAMLAVRRSGVTIALSALQEAGVIGRGRGRVLVCDRAALEAAACGCYGRVQAFAATVAARGEDMVDSAA